MTILYHTNVSFVYHLFVICIFISNILGIGIKCNESLIDELYEKTLLENNDKLAHFCNLR